ncbi:STAS domain-containing protein [Actinoplanes sp. NPDC049668]|uniref:STAS domain-containing protein n=1 Tax=unclassified Actinoplanes TaxID=2626549 RepID=UPI00339E3248
MTVVVDGSSAEILICDQCGHEDAAGEALHDSDLVWPLVAERGWTGSPFATGTHLCPPCSLSTPAQPPAPTREERVHSASYDIRTGADAGVLVITPLTDLDADLSERLRGDLMEAAASYPHIVVDLHAVRFIDSSGLGLLVRARQRARQREATFDLVAPSRFVLTVLHTMRLETAFRTFSDLAVASQTIRRQAAGAYRAS